jgi:predicted DNA-binding protein
MEKRSHVARKSKRLALDIPVEVYDELKKRAKHRFCTMKSYVVQAIVKRLTEEEKYD